MHYRTKSSRSEKRNGENSLHYRIGLLTSEFFFCEIKVGLFLTGVISDSGGSFDRGSRAQPTCPNPWLYRETRDPIHRLEHEKTRGTPEYRKQVIATAEKRTTKI